MPGIPKNKYKLIISLPKVLKHFREDIGQNFGASTKFSFMKAYISKIGEDVDVLEKLMDILTNEEKNELEGSPAYERIKLIIQLKSPRAGTNISAPTQQQSTPDQPESIKSEPILQLVDRYLEQFVKDYKRNRQREIPKSSYNESKRACRVFAAIVGNMPSGNLKKDDVKKYNDLSFDLPKRLNKIQGFTHLTNEDILTHHFDEVIKITPELEDRKSNATLKKEFGSVKKFLDWMKLEGYTYDHLHLSSYIKQISVRSTQKEKPMLNADEYRLLFNSDKYLKGTQKNHRTFGSLSLGFSAGAESKKLQGVEKN